MMIVLIHNAQTGQLQLSTEGGEPALGLALLQQALKMFQQQNGVIAAPPTSQPPPAPRPRNIREIIIPKDQQ
jgi:hypothetical protein